MDEEVNETAQLETVRVERLTVTPEKDVLDKNEQDVRAWLDDSRDVKPGIDDGIKDSELIVAEDIESVASHTLAVDGLTVVDTNCIPATHVNSFSESENVAEILSQSVAGINESTAVECMSSASEQDTSSFMIIDTPPASEFAVTAAGKSDLPLVADDQNGDCQFTDNGPSLNFAEELPDVSELQASVVDVHSLSAVLPECDNEQLPKAAEISVADSSQSESDIIKARGWSESRLCDGVKEPEEASHEAESRSFEELCDGVKEPEEASHAAECHLLNQETIMEQKATETSNDWLSILGHDGLKKRVIHAGRKHDRPRRGQLVTVKCCGRLDDGTEVDRHDELQLVLGDADFILAFDLCIALMEREEKCELVSDAQYAYGKLGREPDVPADANITYEIELLRFEDEPSLSAMPVCDRLRLSNEKRERGNSLYARNECTRAIIVYEKAIRIANADNASPSESVSDLQLLLESRVKCYNNLAATQLKIEAWDDAIQSCNSVLRVQPNNVKALFRKAKCLVCKGNCDTALALLKRAIHLDPDNKTVQNELTRVKRRNKEMESNQRRLYKKMLGTDGDHAAAGKYDGLKSWRWYTIVGIAAVIISASVAAYRRFSHT